MQKSLPIYEGFADGLNDLNKEVVSDDMGTTPVGRAYKKDSGFYFNKVHVFSIAEDRAWHLNLEKTFSENPDKFGGQVYMGAAGLLNFGFIAATKPAAVVLFDVNATQAMFWNDAIRALAENEKVEGFIEFLKEECEKLPLSLVKAFNDKSCPFIQKVLIDGAYRDSCELEDWIEWGLKNFNSDTFWMKRGYEHLHLLAKHRAIGAVTLDVLDKKACQHLKNYLDNVEYRPALVSKDKSSTKEEFSPLASQKGTAIDMLYISNIFGFLDGEKDFSGRDLKNATSKRARENLSMLLRSSESTIIHSQPSRKMTWPADFW